MKILFNIVYYALMAGIALVALLLFITVIPVPGNFEIKIVKSGSMEPAIGTGDLVVIAPSESYTVGDVITFGPDTATQIPTTHRIVDASGTGQSISFVTKGDANEEPDPLATAITDVHGKVILTVPYLGYVLDFAKTPLGFALLVGLPAGIVIIEEISKIVREVKLQRRKKIRVTEEINNQHED